MTYGPASNTRLKPTFNRAHEMATPQPFSTKDRILGAAEELFAQFGFAGTSLRQVTSRADVNIAAVNYHFGSKENLVNEVFRRRMDEMSQQRLAGLKLAMKEHPGELEPILAAFVEPALAIAQDRHGSAFARMVARAYRRLLAVAPGGEAFNVCSGSSHSLANLIDMMSEIAGYHIDVQVNPAFVRANDVLQLTGSNSKLSAVIGQLEPTPLSDTLRWMYLA